MRGQADKYRVLNFHAVRGGRGIALVYFPQTQQTALMSEDVVALLGGLRAFRHVDEHVEHLQSVAKNGQAVAQIVNDLVASGALAKADALLGAAEDTGATITIAAIL